MVFIESEGEKKRKHLIEAYNRADEEKKKEIFGADLEKAAGFRDVREQLTTKKSLVITVMDLGFPPHVLKDDRVLIERHQLKDYGTSDLILYEGSGKIRFGFIKKISRKTAGGRVVVEYAKRETEIIKEKNILALAVKIERNGHTKRVQVGFMRSILGLLGFSRGRPANGGAQGKKSGTSEKGTGKK
jgi:hypothetical protein